MRAFARLVMCVVVMSIGANAFAQCGTIPIISPTNGNPSVPPDASNSVTLKWQAVTGADHYDIYFGPSGQGCTANPRSSSTNSFSPPANEIARGNAYEWRVVAIGTACQTPPTSNCSTFTVTPCPAAPPVPQSPADGSRVNFGSVTLSWTPIANVTGYEVFIGFDGAALTTTGTTANTQKTIVVGPGHTVTWKVVTISPGCSGMSSSAVSFSTNCPSGTPTLRSPDTNATFTAGTAITFDWIGVTGAGGYDILVAQHGSNQFTLIGSTNSLGTSFTKVFPTTGQFDWRVRATFEGDCPDLDSETRTLTITSACDTRTTTLTSPSDRASLKSPVTFQWTDVGAVDYSLYVQKSTDRSPTLLTKTTRTSHSATLDPGTYDWLVVANFANCPSTTSDKRVVIVESSNDGCPANPGQAKLLTPAADAKDLTSPVKFTWEGVNGATLYRVLAAFSNGTIQNLGETTNTSLTADVPAGTGFWLVQTLFGDNCPTTLSDRRTLTVSAGAHCNEQAPSTLSPANNATSVESPVEFRWSEIADATSYQLFVAPGDGEFSFYGDTTDTKLTRFVPAGKVRWLVVAKFAACPETRSAVATFQAVNDTCSDAKIELRTPSEGATATSPVRLSWTAIAGSNIVYRVWASVDNGAPVNLARTDQTEVTLSLPAGDIRWYVDAPRGTCPTVVSADGHFKVAKATNCASNVAPVLVSPVGTERDPAHATKSVTLTWNAAANAIAYRVWLSENGAAFEDIALTRDTHFQIDLDPGSYRWFVQALFEGCDPVASAIAFFDVAATEDRCPTAGTTILEPAQNAVVTGATKIRWTEVDKADKYRVFASRNGEAPVLIGATTDTELERLLPPGQYVIAVEAVFDECPSTTSERRTFTVAEAQNCSTAAATLVNPPDGATDLTPPIDFAWNPVSGALKYVLFLQSGDGAPTPAEATEETHVTRGVPPGRVTWWVVSFFSGCDPTESEHHSFTVKRPETNCDNGRPILLLPNDEAPAVFSPVHFAWSAVPNANGYVLWLASADNGFSIAATTTNTEASVELGTGVYKWFVEATFPGCPPRASAPGEFVVRAPIACGRPEKPDAQVVGQAQSNTKYRVRWTPLPNVGLYELQESTSLDFTNATTFSVTNTSHQFSHEVTGAPVQYLYRVRGVSTCDEQRGPYSDVVGVFVIAPKTNNASAEVGIAENIVQTIFLPGSSTPLKFTATADKPWITITPSTGTLPVEGITLTVSANPTILDLGTNTATINVTYAALSVQGPQTNGVTLATIPVSVSLVTPVTPTGSSAPPPDSLIFPVVGHAAGANDSLFESDIRVTNLTAQPMKYQLKFTPSGTDGTQTGSASSVQIEPNQTLALDDIVSSLFGTGTIGSATGMLEVRPLTTTTTSTGSIFSSVATGLKPLSTAASSRTYNFTPTGTFGQFIPAVRLDEFVGKATSGPSPILSLQQVAQSDAYRANFGFAEASGQSAELTVRVYDTTNALLQSIPVSLQAGEHKQINGMLSSNGVTNLANGRVEVEVTGGNGKVTAYVSEVDNKTNDPLLVSAVVKGGTTSNRYVVPGVAYINSGFAFWVTDLRIFNAGTTSTPATLTFYPQGSPGAAVTRDITLEPGEIKVLDNVVGGLFAQPNGAGGAIAITTPTNTQLTATARTYNQTSNGTYGQYIPGVTPAQSVGAVDRALQILQLEQSSRFRTNVGLSETSGQPVRVEVTLIVPDSIVSPVVTYDLAGNEFRQFSLADFHLDGAIYNARVTVKVISGTGRVTAYGSAIDLTTQDPTYVPAL
ncbi:MAG TPA: hypothetical protein VJZ00_20530 [Thermoanaerobaculia bacterium]|nr:hypothetical protein [Thermoanaerobaculia bacterium]